MTRLKKEICQHQEKVENTFSAEGFTRWPHEVIADLESSTT